MARVILAGYNVDTTVLDALGRRNPEALAATPETLSAAYARISRDPRPVDELRAAARADVGRARASNQRIVFEFGHHSVAEHAVFNFDLIGVSRLVVEAVEARRLASYTEKSQRYIRLGEDFVVPEEVRDAGRAEAFSAYVGRCFERYGAAARALEAAGRDERLAGEDARYLLPLATTAQLGMTVNARTLEYLVRCLAAHPLAEAREVGRALLAAGSEVAPSLLLFVEPGRSLRGRTQEVAAAARALWPDDPDGRSVRRGVSDVRLLHATPDGDARVLAAVLAGAVGMDGVDALDRVGRLGPEGRTRLFDAATRHLGVHDALPREFEHASLTFEVVLSAAAFGQLKRHRMATLTAGPYDPGLGVTTPPSFSEAGLGALLAEAVRDAEAVWADLGGPASPVAPYACLNAHRRRVVLTLNLREMYHVSRLREDSHAQWDIRAVASAMSAEARRAFPVCASLLGGKDRVAEFLTAREGPSKPQAGFE